MDSLIRFRFPLAFHLARRLLAAPGAGLVAATVGLAQPSAPPVSAPSELVRTYPAPADEPLSRVFAVTVGGKSVPAYLARVMAITIMPPHQAGSSSGEERPTGETAFASFDLRGEVQVSVVFPAPIQTAKLLPSSLHLTPKISGRSVTFQLSHPGQFTLEINGDWMDSLELFANPWEAEPPRADDPKVIYFGPGVHEVDRLQVGSGMTVYLAGGAVVYGTGNQGGPIFALEGADIVLRGRGIIDGSRMPKLPKPGASGHILTAQGTRIRVEGVVMRDSPSWNLPVRGSEDVTIQNIKIFGWRANSDGIDLCNSRRVEVSNCYLRTADDLVVVKTGQKGGGESRDIAVRQCILWNEKAHALTMGAELRENVENVRFSDCDIIHDKGHDWLLRVFDCDSGTVRNIVFDRIRIEEARRLFSLWIGKGEWTRGSELGHVEQITFSNITAAVPGLADRTSEFKGFDAAHAVRGVRFEHVLVGGKPFQPGDLRQNEFVSEVSFAP